MIDLDGLIRDASRAALRQSLGQRAIRREMQVREQELAGTQERILVRKRFLDLDDEVGLLEHPGVVLDHRRASLLVVHVRVAGADARATLDQHPVAAFGELVGRRRQERHAVFLLFDLFGDADLHADDTSAPAGQFNEMSSGTAASNL